MQDEAHGNLDGREGKERRLLNILLRMFIAAVLLVLTVGSGILMSSRGKPYRPMDFIFHKTIAFVAVMNMVVFIVDLLRRGNVEFLTVLLLFMGGLSVLALFVSGVMLGRGNAAYDQASTTHSVASVLAIVTIGIFLFIKIWGGVMGPI